MSNNDQRFNIPRTDNIKLGNINPLYGNNDSHYIPIKDRRGRDGFTRVFFNTGVSWMTGGFVGGVTGFFRGLSITSGSAMLKFSAGLTHSSKVALKYGGFLGSIGKTRFD